jgi:hypothetical protein
MTFGPLSTLLSGIVGLKITELGVNEVSKGVDASSGSSDSKDSTEESEE